MSQLEIFEEQVIPGGINANKIGFGELFRKLGGNETFMRVKPVNFINNSSVLAEVFARGDVLVVSMNKGTCFAMKGNTLVLKLTGNLHVKRAN